MGKDKKGKIDIVKESRKFVRDELLPFDDRFTTKIKDSKKRYSRKIKHKKGDENYES